MEFGIAGWLVSEKNIDTLLFFTVEADVADVIDDEVDGAPLDDERERGEIGDLEGGDGESSLRLRELLVREVGGVRKTSIECRFAVLESGSSALSRGISKLRRDRVEPVPNGTAKDDRDALGVPLAHEAMWVCRRASLQGYFNRFPWAILNCSQLAAG